LDTGGGLKLAAPLLGDSRHVFTLNADIMWGAANPLVQLSAAWREGAMRALLLAGDSERLNRARADFQMDRNGRLQRGAALPGYTYLGAQIVEQAAVMRHPEDVFSLNAVWDELAGEGTLAGAVYSDDWVDLGTADQFEAAKATYEGQTT